MQSLIICIYFFSLFIFVVQIQAQGKFWIPLPGLGTVSTTTATPVNELNAQFEKSLNTYRALHSAAPLTSNTTLQEQAKVCADGYADGTYTDTNLCNSTGDYVQQWGSDNAGPTLLAQMTAAEWYKENAALDFPDLTYKPETKNVRQLLWKATNQFGCAVSEPRAADGNVFVLCVYNPVGNVELVMGSENPVTVPTDALRANVQALSAVKSFSFL